MPLVFVHGVATRTSEAYLKEEKERSRLFAALLFCNPQTQVFNAHWGDLVPKWGWGLDSVPDYDAQYERYGLPTPAPVWGNPEPLADHFFARVALRDFAEAVDLLFGATFADAAANSVSLPDDFIKLADAATQYVAANWYNEADPKKRKAPDWVKPTLTNEQFAHELMDRVRALAQIQGPEQYGIDDVVNGIGRGLRRIVDIVRNKASRAVLAAGRDGANRAVALFIGDVFAYLRDRPPAQNSTRENIRKEIQAQILKAAPLRNANDPLIVVGHSMGGVITFDMLSDPDVKQSLQEGAPGLEIDAFISVGSQIALFEEMKLYTTSNTTVVKPAKVAYPFGPFVKHWLNVFDDTDPLSYLCKPVFNGVDDFMFSSETGLISAHTAYFSRPGFYERGRARLRAAGLFA